MLKTKDFSHLRLVTPNAEKGTVMPRRPANADLRTREYLTADEIERLLGAAKSNRYGLRDHCLLLVIYRHGLRAVEACGLEWSQIDFKAANLHVNRAKNGSPSVQPIEGDELRLLRGLHRESGGGRYVFMTERGAPFTVKAINMLVKRAADKAGLEIKAHAHMLRHSTGFFLANRGVDTRTIQAYLGHKNIQHTTRYTALAPDRFKGLWE